MQLLDGGIIRALLLTGSNPCTGGVCRSLEALGREGSMSGRSVREASVREGSVRREHRANGQQDDGQSHQAEPGTGIRRQRLPIADHERNAKAAFLAIKLSGPLADIQSRLPLLGLLNIFMEILSLA